jgi:hypothetical protein
VFQLTDHIATPVGFLFLGAALHTRLLAVCSLAEYVKGELKGAHAMLMQQAGTSKAAIEKLQNDVSYRLGEVDTVTKAAEERLQLVIDELNAEVEQVLLLSP